MGKFGFFVDEDKYYCWYCNKVKLIEDFVKDRSDRKGFKSRCKKCFNEYCRNWRSKNEKNYKIYIKERVDRGYYREYYEKNKDRIKELHIKWNEKKRSMEKNE